MIGLLATVVVPLILGIVLIWFAKKNYGKYNDTGNAIWGIGALCIATAAIVLVVVYPGSYFCSMDTVSEMEAFQGHTMEAYNYTISETKNLEISAAAVGLIDVAYLEQGKTTGERIKELRNKVEWYNRNLYQIKRHNAHWLLDDFTYDLTENLTPIVIK